MSVDGADVTVAIHTWRRQEVASVRTFKIGKQPVSVALYARCVDAGACGQASAVGSACAPEASGVGATAGKDANLPMTCLEPNQAAAFCAWVGGRLPTAAEWLLAARGPAPALSSTGSLVTDHPDFCTSNCSLERYRVGQHAESHSPSGVEDILLTGAEILRTTPDDRAPGCRQPQEAGCVAFSNGGGTIDGLASIAGPDNVFGAQSFRCVWEVTP
ncbi:MAG: SUMF1/EgtB/PvdO family nonheme iron enzyme [Myxococcales bacterium]|nr:SUMF1/EgtB/PvdO family nonheme iron enzyme [Myxococcales bacterium]